MKIVEQDQDIFSVFLDQFGEVDAQGLIVLEYIFELMYRGEYASLPVSSGTEQRGYKSSIDYQGEPNLSDESE